VSIIRPLYTPWQVLIFWVFGSNIAITVLNCAVFCSGGMSSSLSSNFSYLSLSVPLCHLADFTPGSPFNTSTSRPVSSASVIWPVIFAYVIAFIIALPSIVIAGSSTSKSLGISVLAKSIMFQPSIVRVCVISFSFPLFLVAISSVFIQLVLTWRLFVGMVF